MNVLIACEYSGILREAFRSLGHYAVSCDLLPTEQPGAHIKGDVRKLLAGGWGLMIAHPPCTLLTSAGARWWTGKETEQQEAIDFVHLLWAAPIPRVAIENPIGCLSSRWRKPTQIIQPWMFGHGEVKATCLWLRGLPPLTPTDVVSGRQPRVHYMAPGPNRWKERSRTLTGVAAAMANQWGMQAPAQSPLTDI